MARVALNRRAIDDPMYNNAAAAAADISSIARRRMDVPGSSLRRQSVAGAPIASR